MRDFGKASRGHMTTHPGSLTLDGKKVYQSQKYIPLHYRRNYGTYGRSHFYNRSSQFLGVARSYSNFGVYIEVPFTIHSQIQMWLDSCYF